MSDLTEAAAAAKAASRAARNNGTAGRVYTDADLAAVKQAREAQAQAAADEQQRQRREEAERELKKLEAKDRAEADQREKDFQAFRQRQDVAIDQTWKEVQAANQEVIDASKDVDGIVSRINEVAFEAEKGNAAIGLGAGIGAVVVSGGWGAVLLGINLLAPMAKGPGLEQTAEEYDSEAAGEVASNVARGMPDIGEHMLGLEAEGAAKIAEHGISVVNVGIDAANFLKYFKGLEGNVMELDSGQLERLQGIINRFSSAGWYRKFRAPSQDEVNAKFKRLINAKKKLEEAEERSSEAIQGTLPGLKVDRR